VAEPFEMLVELGKTREFARATGSQHPRHSEAENAVTPPTFLMTAASWQGPESNAWPKDRDRSRVLHASQEFIFPKNRESAKHRFPFTNRAQPPVTLRPCFATRFAPQLGGSRALSRLRDLVATQSAE
jgi:N-terminal half of MaoC dehydratase